MLSTAEFIDAWAAHEREAARLALAARRLEACGEWAHDGGVDDRLAPSPLSDE